MASITVQRRVALAKNTATSKATQKEAKYSQMCDAVLGSDNGGLGVCVVADGVDGDVDIGGGVVANVDTDYVIDGVEVGSSGGNESLNKKAAAQQSAA